MSAQVVVVRCSSCGRALPSPGGTQFPCPQCGVEIIGRDARCRDQSVTYRCSRCGFEGP
jgi:Zn-ribbon RNA-binding protein